MAGRAHPEKPPQLEGAPCCASRSCRTRHVPREISRMPRPGGRSHLLSLRHQMDPMSRWLLPTPSCIVPPLPRRLSPSPRRGLCSRKAQVPQSTPEAKWPREVQCRTQSRPEGTRGRGAYPQRLSRSLCPASRGSQAYWEAGIAGNAFCSVWSLPIKPTIHSEPASCTARGIIARPG